MKFRVTIMPLKNTVNQVNASGVNTFNSSKLMTSNVFASGNSNTNIGGLSSLVSGSVDGMILSPDEIVSVILNISDYSTGNTAKTETNVSVTITGKILSHIEEADSERESSLSMTSLLSGFMNDKINGLTKGLTNGAKILGGMFENTLNFTLTNMIGNYGGEKFGLSSLYKMNFQNSIEMANWALEYGEGSDYRDIVVEVMINENMSKSYILPDMFAVDYDENLGTGKGEGSFTLVLKQKRYSNRKIQIK